MSAASFEPKTLFVSNINYKTDENALIEHFGSYGKVVSARLIKSKIRGRLQSQGIGFVEFSDSNSVDDAIALFKKSRDANQPIQLDGRGIFVQRARVRAQRKNDAAFVSGIPEGTSSDALKDAFKSFGAVDAKVIRTDSVRGRGFGFVQFATTAARDAAVNGAAGVKLNGSAPVVRAGRHDYGFKPPLRRGRRQFRRAPKASE